MVADFDRIHLIQSLDGVNVAINSSSISTRELPTFYIPGYHNGTFYIITTCVYRPPDTDEGTCTNFIITAEDVAGPWSQPHVIEDAPGQVDESGVDGSELG